MVEGKVVKIVRGKTKMSFIIEMQTSVASLDLGKVLRALQLTHLDKLIAFVDV
jgi:hypothetical protein